MNLTSFRHLRVLVAIFLLLTCSLAVAMAKPPNWKPETLSDAEEQKWIEALKLHETGDGASVMQVLMYTEKLRPNRFKIEAFDILYRGSDGKPDGVRIGYWIGEKRLQGDEFADLSYKIQKSSAGLTVVAPKNTWTDDTIVNALERGRDTFIAYIDKMYLETCINPDTKKRIC